MVNILNKISLKNIHIVILLLQQNFTSKSGTRQTGLPSSFYMTPSEIFIRNNKNIASKITNRDITTSK